jgi:branched-chain amino acid transport system substrate-binding protein
MGTAGPTNAKRRNARAAFALVACCVALVAVGCGNDGGGDASTEDAGAFAELEPIATPEPCPDVPGVEKGSIRVGGLIPETGLSAASFSRAEDGIRARFELANARGELGGRQLELVVADDAADAATNLKAARTLVENDDVFGIIEVSPAAAGSAQYLANHDIPVTGWHAAQPVWGEHPNMFTFNGIDPDNQHTTRNAVVFTKLGARKIAVVSGGNPTRVRFVRGISESIDDSPKLDVVYETVDVPLGSTDFTEEVQAIVESGADGVYAGMDFMSNVALSEQLKRAGASVVTVFPGGYDPLAIDAGAAGFDGVYFGLEFVPFEIDTKGFRTFAFAMGDRPLGQVPVLGWLSADIFVNGLKAAGVECPTREAFITNLRLEDDYDADGLLLPVDFSEQFGHQYECAFYVQVAGGAFAPQFDGEPVCGEPFEPSDDAASATDGTDSGG